MSKTSFVFAGQGSQYVGMGKDFYEKYDCAKKVYKIAEEVLGYSLIDKCENLPIEELSKTKYAQCAIFALSAAGFEILKEKGYTPDSVAGFSLGEISALYASGCYDLYNGFKVVKERSLAMQKASEKNGGGMYAILNVPTDIIENECKNDKGYVIPVNYNSPVQTVIAGEEDALLRVTEKLASYERARCVKLNVSSAFHSKYMIDASEEFYENIKDVEFKNIVIPTYSDITANILNEDNMRLYLKNQIISPVKWVDIVKNMINDGTDKFIELGSGKTLCGLIKKTDRNVKAVNIENEETLIKGVQIYE